VNDYEVEHKFEQKAAKQMSFAGGGL